MTRIISKYWFDYSNEALNNIESIKDKIRLIIKSINSKYPNWIKNNDARANFFIGLKKVLQSTQFSYRNIRYCLVDIKYWERFVKKFDANEIVSHIEEYNVLILMAWVYAISTIIEESIRLILKKINPTACNDGSDDFKNIYDSLFKTLKLDRHKKLFDLFRLTRNLIHTNGTFNPKNKKNNPIEYKGTNYTFIVGERPSFINIHFIANLTSDLILATNDIVMHNSIINFNDIPRTKRKTPIKK